MSPEKKAVLSAGGILAFGAIGRWANGFVYSSAEAKDLISSLSESGLYLGSAMAASSGTTLALMLTVIGIVRRMDQDFDAPIYRRINLVSLLSTLSLAGSVVMLLVLTLPVGDFDKLPSQWYPTLYNVVYAMVIGLSALLVSTVVLLYGTVRVLIANITPNDEV